MIEIIGLSGKKHSGKDTFCQILRSKIFFSHRVAFADHLKFECADALGISMYDIEQDKELYRPLLQWWGTEYRRTKNGADYWVDKVNDSFEAVRGESLVIVTDVRFKNEAQWVKSNNGLMVNIKRDNALSNDSHVSENQLNDYPFDFVVDNNGTLEQLNKQADILIQKYGIPPV